MVVVPVMAGGVGEGAIPLSMGYSEILHQDQAQLLSHLLPVVLFANLVAIVLAGCLKALGRRYPDLTGNGTLEQAPLDVMPVEGTVAIQAESLNIEKIFVATLFGISLYLIGMLMHRWLPLPAPVTMLILAVVLKVSNLLPAWLQQAATIVGRFFAVTVTYPLLFAVALTPWASVKESLHPANLMIITIVVVTLTVTGFFAGKWMHLYPIESALINACHTGSGGTGDVAILTAAERLNLMPFAQVATRIGGAITVTITLLLLRLLMRGH